VFPFFRPKTDKEKKKRNTGRISCSARPAQDLEEKKGIDSKGKKERGRRGRARLAYQPRAQDEGERRGREERRHPRIWDLPEEKKASHRKKKVTPLPDYQDQKKKTKTMGFFSLPAATPSKKGGQRIGPVSRTASGQDRGGKG